MASSCAGLAELVATCKKRSALLMVGYNLRFLKPLIRFRELLHSGAVGKIFSVRSETGQYLPSWRAGTDYRESVSARRSLGGGVLLELSHELDYLRLIFGEVDWVTAVLRRQSNLEIDVEDTAHLILGFARQNGEEQLIGNLSLDFLRHDTTRTCVAIGEKGSLRWDGVAGTVQQLDAGEIVWRTLFQHSHQRHDSYRSEWHQFLTCVENDEVPPISGTDGMKVLQLIETARQSSVMQPYQMVSDTAQILDQPE